MSKILNAVQRAEQERRAVVNGDAPRQLDGLKLGLEEEIRRATEALGQQKAAAPGAAADVPVPASAGAPAPAEDNGAAPAPAAASAAGPSPAAASLARAIEDVTRQLEACERQAARQAAEQARVSAQLAAVDELLGRLAQEQLGLRRRLEESRQAAASLEAARARAAQQLVSLHECETLAHASTVAEQALQANAALVAHLLQTQQRATDELSTYRKRGEALERQSAEISRRLAQAIAAAEPASPQAPRSGS
jgi:hypothetical protein